MVPPIPGVQLPHVISAEDALVGKVPTNDLIVVCGGGEVGGETAAALAMQEKSVTVVEMADDILKELGYVPKYQLTQILDKYHVARYTNTKVCEIKENSVVCETASGKKEFPALTVVLAFGYSPVNELQETAQSHCNEVYTIGGAVKTSNALIAIQEGYQTGLKI